MAAAIGRRHVLVQRQAGAVQSLDALPFALRARERARWRTSRISSARSGRRISRALYPYPTSIPLWQSAGAAALLIAITVWRGRVRCGTAVPARRLVLVSRHARAGDRPRAGRQPAVRGSLHVRCRRSACSSMVAWAARDGSRRGRPGRAPWPRVGVVVVLAVGGHDATGRCAYWKDSVTLWEHAVAVTGDNYRAQTNLGFCARGSRPAEPRAGGVSGSASAEPDVSRTRTTIWACCWPTWAITTARRPSTRQR